MYTLEQVLFVCTYNFANLGSGTFYFVVSTSFSLSKYFLLYVFTDTFVCEFCKLQKKLAMCKQNLL